MSEDFQMRKLLISFAGTVLWIGVTAAQAQEVSLPRYEVGVQFAALDFREFSHVLGRRNEFAVGGRFTMNLTNLLAVEAQTDFYPTDEFFPDRRKIQGLFGLKAGGRTGRVGFFGKARPGFIHVRSKRNSICLIPEGCAPPPPGDPTHFGRFWLALDAGAVFEVYPSQRWVLRLDAGDLFVRRFKGTNPSGKIYYSSHNLQMAGGAAIRF
jgi:hypothetical protein